jgi:hypothetical protein
MADLHQVEWINTFVRQSLGDHFDNIEQLFESSTPYEVGLNCTSQEGITSLPGNSMSRTVQDLFGGSLSWKKKDG